ncbi:MAG TPA: hypothetical protein VHM67_12980 [Gemmatimonadaceae bacterium]|nr:hypothetical protein [Gemmatimonadaceae bacterium]
MAKEREGYDDSFEGGTGDGYLGQAYGTDPDAGTVGEENTGGGEVGRSRGPGDGLREGAPDDGADRG